MSEKDLIKLKPKGDVYSDKIRSKLKGSSSDKRKIAQRISGLKRANPENVEKKLLALISDPSISALEIIIMIEAVKHNENLRPETVIQLINTAIKAHSIIFGTKTFNVNMNVSPLSANRVQKVWYEIQEKRKKEEQEKDLKIKENIDNNDT